MIALSKMQKLTKSQKNNFCLSVISSEVFFCHLKTAKGRRQSNNHAVPFNFFFFFFACSNHARPSLIAQLVKNSPAMQETWVWTLVWEDPLEKGKATHFRILAWRIPWTVVSQRVEHYWATFTFNLLLNQKETSSAYLYMHLSVYID